MPVSSRQIKFFLCKPSNHHEETSSDPESGSGTMIRILGSGTLIEPNKRGDVYIFLSDKWVPVCWVTNMSYLLATITDDENNSY